MTVESNYGMAIATLSDWSKSLACTSLLTNEKEKQNRSFNVFSTVREIAKTVYIKSCDMIGRGKTKTNHIGREGLNTSKIFVGKKGSHIGI